jgi:hypothetical protein
MIPCLRGSLEGDRCKGLQNYYKLLVSAVLNMLTNAGQANKKFDELSSRERPTGLQLMNKRDT